MDISPETWNALYKVFGGGIAGAIITAATLFGIARTKAQTEQRHSDQEYQLGMTKEQRLLLESLHAQIQAQATRTDGLHRELSTQREYYEARIDELREGYRSEMLKQEEVCQRRIDVLQRQVDTLMNQRKKFFQDLPGTDDNEKL